jgi:drug/metabolite transporter (DMT)-like permease
MGIRHTAAGGLILAWALPRGDAGGDRIGWTQVRAGFIFGGALFLLGHGGLAWAQQTVPSGVASLLIGTIPLIVRKSGEALEQAAACAGAPRRRPKRAARPEAIL